jgi:flagellar motor switch protein FliN/FliY
MADDTEIENKEDVKDTDSETASAGQSNAMDLKEIHEPDINADDDDTEYQTGEPMAKDVEAIYDIPVQISAVLGRSTMQVSQLLKLGRGAVVELDRKVGEAIDIYVNNRLVARGEVVVVEDKLGVTMTEIVKSDRN